MLDLSHISEMSETEFCHWARIPASTLQPYLAIRAIWLRSRVKPFGERFIVTIMRQNENPDGAQFYDLQINHNDRFKQRKIKISPASCLSSLLKDETLLLLVQNEETLQLRSDVNVQSIGEVNRIGMPRSAVFSARAKLDNDGPWVRDGEWVGSLATLSELAVLLYAVNFCAQGATDPTIFDRHFHARLLMLTLLMSHHDYDTMASTSPFSEEGIRGALFKLYTHDLKIKETWTHYENAWINNSVKEMFLALGQR